MIISKAIHVAEKGIVSFFETAEECSIVYVYHIALSVPLMTDSLDASTSWLFSGKLHWKSGCVCFSLGFSLHTSPRMRLLYHVFALISFFLRNLDAVLHSAYSSLRFHKQCIRTSFPHTHSSIYCYRVFWWWWVWPVWDDNRHCSFALHFCKN